MLLQTKSLCLAIICAVVLLAKQGGADSIQPPRVLVDGFKVELIASEPQIVTPVGLAFDRQGRLLVVESHTHQRQEDYDGPQGDRVRMFRDTTGDGKLDTWSTFAEGYTHAMNIAVHPTTGDVYLVCRNDVRILDDTNGDGKADAERVIVRLETKENYPHNALSGIAFTRHGLALGLGENFGGDYRLVGSDGSSLSGRGGVGIVFTCDPQGGKLKEFAKGFWNPFAIASVGEKDEDLFTVDNDPDASPPCRLIHVLPGGDYGHRWEYGRAGLHPLQAWDGELPGTLGMLAGTGEAPCAAVPHRGYLWVTSWGEHRIERYELSVASPSRLAARREIVVQAGAEFRPTGMAVAPDGSLYFADWVSRSYPVHGAGRIWRMTLDDSIEAPAIETPKRLTALDQIWEKRRLAKGLPAPQRTAAEQEDLQRDELVAVIMEREKGQTNPTDLMRRCLTSNDADVRLYGVRWIADEHQTELKPDVQRLLAGDIPSGRYYHGLLGAIEWLGGDRKMRHSGIADGLLARELRNGRRRPAAHAIALRMISPQHEWLTLERLQKFLASDHLPLRQAAVRKLPLHSSEERFALLASLAGDANEPDSLRADAVAGLAADVTNQEKLLRQLGDEESSATGHEARRVLRLAKLIDSPKTATPAAERIDDWLAILGRQKGDVDSGRRLFHSPLGARCGMCHQHGGQGGEVGPELTHVGQKLSRRRLLESILLPSQEIAPRYEPWILEVDGKVVTGLRMSKAGDNGVELYADDQGHIFELRSEAIETRTPSRVSIMPAGLEQLVSVQDMRDLLAFLQSAP